jgi:endonuclease YncB( thermonuclease family)
MFSRRRKRRRGVKTLSVATYAALRKQVEETLLLAQQKIDQARVQTYWQTGRFINQHVQTNGSRAEYGKEVVLKLSRDLKVGDDLLYRCSRFAAQFPISASWRKLSWSHLRALCRVHNDRKRLELSEQASRNEWPSDVLETKVRNLLWDERAKASAGKPPSLLPAPALGPFYTYQVIALGTIHSRATEPLLDVGFSHTIKLSRFTSWKFCSAQAVKSSANGTWDMGRKHKPGAIVTSTKDARGHYFLRPQKSESRGTSSESLLFNYRSFVERVIDGDTLKLEIDTGFDEQCHETIRLRGIDCPEINTSEGKAAKHFVERELGSCEFIILKSTQTRKEKWGRYLGDVFYTNKAGKQVLLNNLLLEKGMAVRVRK